jgi:hypothetical protein
MLRRIDQSLKLDVRTRSTAAPDASANPIVTSTRIVIATPSPPAR